MCTPTNPPLFDRSVDAEITISNSKYLELTNWAKAQQQTQYTLRIFNPKSIGLNSTEQNSVEEFIEKLLLSFNLSLAKGAFLIYRADMDPTRFELKKQKPIASKMEKTKNGAKIIINETVVIRDSVFLTHGFKETIDESNVLQILDKIRKLENTTSQLTKIQDLKKSLDNYIIAMSAFYRLSIFKHLFTSVELAVNSDGDDRNGTRLDDEISILGNIPNTIAKQWRQFNDRAKHIDNSPTQKKEYEEGINRLGEMIINLRTVAGKIILNRLQNI